MNDTPAQRILAEDDELEYGNMVQEIRNVLDGKRSDK
jgi:hypothetical protein